MSSSQESLMQPLIVRCDSNIDAIDIVEQELFDCRKNLRDLGRDWILNEYEMKLQQLASQNMDGCCLVMHALLYDLLTGSEIDIDRVRGELKHFWESYKANTFV
jgi:hypothetical protein